MHVDAETLSRAQGCLLGQLAGDSLGSLVEFQLLQKIPMKASTWCSGNLWDGGTWSIPGQLEYHSEMALMLARMLIKQRRYDAEGIRILAEFHSVRLWQNRFKRS